jgi:hypothetical protein
MKFLFHSILFFLLPALMIGQMQKVERSLTQQIQDRVAVREGRMPPSHQTEKCAFGLVARIRTLDRQLSDEENNLLKLLVTRPVCQTSILSSQGHFRIHFDSTGVNAGSLLNQTYEKIPNTARAYADSVAEIFEYVWQKEIREMAYPAPPTDGGIGGDDAYDVYIKEYNDYYGETYPDSVLNPTDPAQLSTSFIQIDNDYFGYYSSGLDGVRVTAAHEFFHSIQIGNYRLWLQDASPFFYEISSTWMEDEVFPTINDYLQYMNRVFLTTDIPLNRTNGFVEYGRAIFAKYLEQRFGQSIIHDIWDALRIIPSLDAIMLTLHNRGTSLENEYPEYALWHYYTGTRADTSRYFPDGNLYPAVKIYGQIQFIPPKYEGNYEMYPLAFKYFQVMNSDTATLLATNVNVTAALIDPYTPFTFRYIVRSDGGDDGYTWLPNGWSVKLEADDPTMWKSIAFLKLSTMTGDDHPYPNPFIADGMRQIAFPLWLESAIAELTVYSSDLREIFHTQKKVGDKFYNKEMIQWDGVMNNGVLAPSGIYYYTLTVKGDTHRGKIAIIKR